MFFLRHRVMVQCNGVLELKNASTDDVATCKELHVFHLHRVRLPAVREDEFTLNGSKDIL